MTTNTTTKQTKSEEKPLPQITLQQDDYYFILHIGKHAKITWRYTGVPNCCAFAMVTTILINGNGGDSWPGMGKGWTAIKSMLNKDHRIYPTIVEYLKKHHDPRQVIAGWCGLGSMVFMNLNCPTKELREFNKWFTKLWSDAWDVKWEVVGCGVSRYKSDNKEYGINAYLWQNIPFPRSEDEKEAFPDVEDYDPYNDDDDMEEAA